MSATQSSASVQAFAGNLITFALRSFELVAVVVSWIFFLLSTWYLAALFVLCLLFSFTWGSYSATIITNVDYGMRCVVYPFYKGWPSLILTFIQTIYDTFVCWYNVVVWTPFGASQDVVIPILLDCGLMNTVRLASYAIYTFLVDFVLGYIITFNFLYIPFDYGNFCSSWTASWLAWQQVICCACNDLCVFARLQPIFLPVSIMYNPLSLLGSNMMGDPNTCAATGEFFNAFMVAAQFVWRMIAALFTLTAPKIPTFQAMFDHLCASVTFWVRAWENNGQYFVDSFLPFDFDVHGFLGFIGSAWCITMRYLSGLLDMILNIVKVVQYPSNPYYGTVTKDNLIVLLNMLAPVYYVDGLTLESYYLPTNASVWPGRNQSNPMYNQTRFSEHVCTFVTRIFCDPANVKGGTCFTPSTSTLFGNFNLCCVIAAPLSLVADIVAALFSWSLHLYSLTQFFTFLDRQLSTTIWADDVVRMFSCLADVFQLVPTVGYCMGRVMTLSFAVMAYLMSFFVRFTLGIITLPWFLSQGQTNFLTTPNVAVTVLNGILDLIDKPGEVDTIVNCLCFVLNFGVQISPPPCTACNATGYIQPPTNRRQRVVFEADAMLSPAIDYTGAKLNPLFKWSTWRSGDFSKVHGFPASFDVEKSMAQFNAMSASFLAKVETLASNLQQQRTTIPPTVPPVSPCIPIPGCFNVCCTFKAILQTLVQFLRTAFNMLNSLFTQAPDFPYYSGGGFQDDVTSLVTYFFQIPTCLCNILNLVLPIQADPNDPSSRPDICCWVVQLGNLLNTAIIVIIRGSQSLALGGPDFVYFTEGGFLVDVNVLFDITYRVITCLCTLMTAVQYSLGPLIPGSLDLCCSLRNMGLVYVESGRLAFSVVITLGTIQSNGIYYWRDPNCTYVATNCIPDVEKIGFVKQVDIVLDAYFGSPGGTCGQGVGGITQCACQIINTLLPARGDPLDIVSVTNCPYVNLCCFIGGTGYAGKELGKFAVRLFATTWQAWTPPFQAKPGVYTNGQPIALTAFWFCDEYVANPPGSCGKIQPVISQISAIFGTCACGASTQCGSNTPPTGYINAVPGLFAMFDRFVALLFKGWDCFCGPFGILKSLSKLVCTLLTQVFILLRRANDPTYWNPSLSTTAQWRPPNSPLDTWASRFLGPIFATVCEITGSYACLLQAILPGCSIRRFMALQAVTAWPAKMLMNTVSLVEGFLDILLGKTQSCESNIPGNLFNSGVSAGCIASALVNVLGSYTYDPIFGDGSLICTGPCDCYNPDAYQQTSLGLTQFCARTEILPLPPGFNQQNLNACYNTGECGGLCQSPTSFTPQNLQLSGCECWGKTQNFTYVGKLYSLPDSVPDARWVESRRTQKGLCVKVGYPVPQDAIGVEACVADGTCHTKLCQKFANGAASYPGFGGKTFSCVAADFPVCKGRYGNRILDGVLLGAGRLLQCVAFSNLFVGLPAVFNQVIGVIAIAINTFMSVMWQWSRAWTNFIITLAFFFISFASSVFTSGFDFVSTVGFLFSAPLMFLGLVIQLVTQLIAAVLVMPTPPPFIKRDDNNFFDPNVTGFHVAQNLEGFDESDCFTHPTHCACRLLGLDDSDAYCYTNENGQPVVGRHLRSTSGDQPVVFQNIMKWISTSHFSANSSCDHLIQMLAATNQNWDQTPAAQRKQWQECVVHRARGVRLAATFPLFPENFYYSHDAYMTLAQNAARKMLDDAERIQAQHEAERKRQRRNRSAGPRYVYSREEENRLYESLENRRVYMHRMARNTYGIPEESPLLDVLIQVDAMETKFQAGHYGKLLRHTEAYLEWSLETNTPLFDYSTISSDLWESAKQLFQAHADAAQAVFPTTSIMLRNLREAAETAAETWSSRGFMEQYHRFMSRAVSWPLGDLHLNNIVYEMARYTPIVNWFADPASRGLDKVPLYQHWRNLTLSTRFPLWEPNAPSPLRAIELAKEEVLHRYRAAHVTRERAKHVDMNWISLQRVYWTIQYALNPGSIRRDIHERFILDAGCPIIYGIVNLTAETVGYCYTVQTRNAHRLTHTTERLRRAWLPTSSGNDTATMPLKQSSSSWTWSHSPYNDAAWEHPIASPHNANHMRRAAHKNYSAMDHEQWRLRHKMSMRSDPALGINFWLTDAILEWIDAVFGWNLQQGFSQWSTDVTDWLNNPNLSLEDAAAGNVGGAYWVRFLGLCKAPLLHRPLSNLNCSIGIGLEAALGQVLWWSLLIFGLLSILLPAVLMPLIGFSAFIFYIVLVPAMAWHYSPRCWLMTPSALGGGVSIPIWPFPIAPPALPTCMIDEVVALLNKWITNCYDFVLPRCMVSYNICPVCPERIVWPSCQAVGVGDGWTNLVYAGYLIWGPSFASYVTGFFQTCLGAWSTNIVPYTFQMINNFEQASDTQTCRLNWCFWFTFPSMGVPVIFIIYLCIAISMILPSLISWILALFGLILASPFGLLVPNPSSNYNASFGQWTGPPEAPSSMKGDDEEEDDDKKKQRQQQIRTVMPMGEFLNHLVQSALFARVKY